MAIHCKKHLYRLKSGYQLRLFSTFFVLSSGSSRLFSGLAPSVGVFSKTAALSPPGIHNFLMPSSLLIASPQNISPKWSANISPSLVRGKKHHEKTPFRFPNPQVTPSPAAWVPSGRCDAFPMTWRNCSQDQRGWDQPNVFCWAFPGDLWW